MGGGRAKISSSLALSGIELLVRTGMILSFVAVGSLGTTADCTVLHCTVVCTKQQLGKGGKVVKTLTLPPLGYAIHLKGSHHQSRVFFLCCTLDGIITVFHTVPSKVDTVTRSK